MKLPISPRLLACADLVPPCRRAADVGCDHGYLAIHLIRSGIAGQVIASDINEAPLQSALHNAARYGVREKMSFYRSDGVRQIPHDFDCLICAGMGGDTMVSIMECVSVGGIPVSQLMSKEKFAELAKRTAGAGGEIVNLLGRGSAFYSPATSAIHMAEAYLLDKKSVFSCAAKLNGEYGVSGLYCGVPVVVGANGVEKILEVKMSAEEKAAFDKSVEACKKNAEWVDAHT